MSLIDFFCYLADFDITYQQISKIPSKFLNSLTKKLFS